MSNYSQEQIDEATGNSRPQISIFPTLKFTSADSAKGKSEVKNFTLLSQDKDGKLEVEDCGEKVEIVLMTRGGFRLKKGGFTSNEIQNARAESNVKIYHLIDKAKNKREIAGIGKWKEMKEKYGLSTQQIPYVMIGEKVARLIVLPSSLSNYWEYLESFKDNERPYQFITVVKANEKPKVGEGGEYFEMTFQRGVKLDDVAVEAIVEDIMELRDKLKKNDEAYQIKQDEYMAEKGILPEGAEVVNPTQDEVEDSLAKFRGQKKQVGEKLTFKNEEEKMDYDEMFGIKGEDGESF